MITRFIKAPGKRLRFRLLTSAKTMYGRGLLFYISPLLLFWAILSNQAYCGEPIPTPDQLAGTKIDRKTDPVEIANTFLRIPYRNDGAIDENGRFTTFRRPEKIFKSAGLNCSGLTVAICRYLLQKNFTIEEVQKDRQGDSGPDSERGEQWDYGWDLIFNLAEGMNPRIIGPYGGIFPDESMDGTNMRGFDPQDKNLWKNVLPQMKPGRLYLAGFSKESPRRILHYHVGLFLVDEKGGVWLYQTTHNSSSSYRANIRTPYGMNRLRKAFLHSRNSIKRILILEIKLPVREAPVKSVEFEE